MERNRIATPLGRAPGRAIRSAALALLLAFGALLGAPRAALAASTINVTTTADENGTGTGCSLREAFKSADDNANFGGCTGSGGGAPFTINVPAGTYTLTVDELKIGDATNTNTSIVGAGAASTIIQQTVANRRVFDINSLLAANVSVSISGVTITGGNNPSDNFGGAGIIAGGPGNTLSLSSCIITNNSNNAGLAPKGGGVEFASGGVLNINNCTISNNTAGSAASNLGVGGGVDFELLNNSGAAGQGGLSITNTTFSNNVAGAANSGAGGAVHLAVTTTQAPSGLTISNNTFSGNQANAASNGLGGAIADASSNSVTIQFNRFFNNTATGGATGIYKAVGSTGTINATENWWGCNAGPGNTGCDSIGGQTGNITAAPRLVMSHAPGALTLTPNGSTTLTASFLTDSAGGAVSTANLSRIIGQTIAFNNASRGSLSSAQTTVQANGTATATFTAGSTSSACGAGGADAKFDNQTITAAITVQCADLTATLTNDVSGSATVGQSWTWTATIANGGNTSANYSSGQTMFSANLANSASISYGSPTSNNPNVACSINGSQDLVCTASAALSIAPAGSFTVSFSAVASATGNYAVPRSGGSCAVDPSGLVVESNEANNACSNSVSVTAPDLTISKSHTGDFTQGQTDAQYTITVSNAGSAPTNGTVTVVDTLPTGLTATALSGTGWSCTLGTLTCTRSDALAAAASYPNITLTVNVANDAPASITNSATVSGGGEANTSNDTASDPTLIVATAPTITTQPQDQTTCAGGTVTFTAAASGSPAPTVQWQFSTNNGTTWNDLAGATSPSLTVTATSGSGTQFRAVFTNSSGSATTNAATLTINTAPAITTQPTDQSATAGDTATFTAAASGSPAPTVQWQVSSDNGATWTNVGGATSTTLSFTAQSGDSGNQYRAVFTNGCGTATTNAATLTVTTAPAITTQPTNQTVNAGATATFNAAASGSPAPTVQWQSSPDGSTWTDISGATSTTLSFTAQASDDGKQYRAVFTSAAGSATTNAATLTVIIPPIITTQPTDQTVLVGQIASFSAVASGTSPLTVQWQVSTDNGATWTDLGASGTTIGTSQINLVTQASDNGKQFRVVFSNGAGSATSNAAKLTVVTDTTPPDTTIDPPAPSNPSSSTSASFTFSGSDNQTAAADLTFECKLDGGNFGNCTSPQSYSSLSLGSHTFQVRAKDAAGNVDPTPASYTWEIHAATALLYNGGQIVNVGSSFTPAALLSSSASACASGQVVSFSLDANPLTGAVGTYALGTATTNSSGQATMPAINTSGWLEGVYTLKATFAGTSSCDPSSDTATLTVASPGEAANGGGWYTLSGSGRINFGFTVRKVDSKCTSGCAYKGQLLLINNSKWRLKGNLTSYSKTSTGQGAASGTGDLYWWNSSLNGGLGDWALAKSGVSYTINVYDSGKSGKSSTDAFGIRIVYTPVAPQPSTLPNSTPQPLKGGDIKVS